MVVDPVATISKHAHNLLTLSQIHHTAVDPVAAKNTFTQLLTLSQPNANKHNLLTLSQIKHTAVDPVAANYIHIAVDPVAAPKIKNRNIKKKMHSGKGNKKER